VWLWLTRLKRKGKSEMTAAIGLAGIAVMGENLVLNLESKGFQVAVYNRTSEIEKRKTKKRKKLFNRFFSLSKRPRSTNSSPGAAKAKT